MTDTTIEQSNWLAHLAYRIKDEHTRAGDALKKSVQAGMRAGELLIEARALIPHGAWLPWLRDRVEISPRMAQRYVQLARHRAEIEANTTHVSHLTINGALALLAAPSIAEKVVAAVETAEAVQDKAEAARRQVILDAIKCNAEAVEAINERWLPDDFRPGGCPEVQEFFDQLMEAVANNCREYELAVECGDHARAFALMTWGYDLSVDMRSMGEDIARHAEAQQAAE